MPTAFRMTGPASLLPGLCCPLSGRRARTRPPQPRQGVSRWPLYVRRYLSVWQQHAPSAACPDSVAVLTAPDAPILRRQSDPTIGQSALPKLSACPAWPVGPVVFAGQNSQRQECRDLPVQQWLTIICAGRQGVCFGVSVRMPVLMTVLMSGPMSGQRRGVPVACLGAFRTGRGQHRCLFWRGLILRRLSVFPPPHLQ